MYAGLDGTGKGPIEADADIESDIEAEADVCAVLWLNRAEWDVCLEPVFIWFPLGGIIDGVK